MFVILKSLGKTPVEREALKTNSTGFDVQIFTIFSMSIEMLHGPTALPDFSSDISDLRLFPEASSPIICVLHGQYFL